MALVEALASGLHTMRDVGPRPPDVETKRLPFAEASPAAIGIETLCWREPAPRHSGDITLPALLKGESSGATARAARPAGRHPATGSPPTSCVRTPSPWVWIALSHSHVHTRRTRPPAGAVWWRPMHPRGIGVEHHDVRRGCPVAECRPAAEAARRAASTMPESSAGSVMSPEWTRRSARGQQGLDARSRRCAAFVRTAGALFDIWGCGADITASIAGRTPAPRPRHAVRFAAQRGASLQKRGRSRSSISLRVEMLIDADAVTIRPASLRGAARRCEFLAKVIEAA